MATSCRGFPNSQQLMVRGPVRPCKAMQNGLGRAKACGIWALSFQVLAQQQDGEDDIRPKAPEHVGHAIRSSFDSRHEERPRREQLTVYVSSGQRRSNYAGRIEVRASGSDEEDVPSSWRFQTDYIRCDYEWSGFPALFCLNPRSLAARSFQRNLKALQVV